MERRLGNEGSIVKMPASHEETWFMVQFCVSVPLVCVNRRAGFCFVVETREGSNENLRAWELNLPCKERPPRLPGLDGGSRQPDLAPKPCLPKMMLPGLHFKPRLCCLFYLRHPSVDTHLCSWKRREGSCLLKLCSDTG